MSLWYLVIGLSLIILVGRWWRRRSHRALINAMSHNKSVQLPLLADAASVEIAEAYHRIRTKAREELKSIDGQRNELRALLSTMVDGVVAVDQNEQILNINDAARDFFDLQDVDVRGQFFIEVCRSSGIHQILKDTLVAESALTRELKIPGNPNCFLSVSGIPYRSPKHKRGALLILRDMTRIHRLEGHRSEFVANVSHELKTPITSLKGYAETLLDGALDEPDNTENFVRIILKQANRLAALVEDLLQLSRIEREEGIELQSVNLAHVIEGAVSLCDEVAEERGSSVTTKFDRDLLVRCNPEMVELAVRNLVENALKYSPDGSEVEVRADCLVDQVTISVTDQGPGIAAEHHERLFERFYRIDKSRSKALGGTGLGLAIVKHIAQNHGGQIRVDSIVGLGSTFTLVWPN